MPAFEAWILLYPCSPRRNEMREMNGVEQKIAKNGCSERRSGIDRRRKRFPYLKDLLNYHRRRYVRRKSDFQKIVVFDTYSNAINLTVVAILLLSLCDAFLTLFLSSIGAVERNPIMAYYLNIDEFTFVFVKYGLTVLSVAIILTLPYAFTRYLHIPVRRLLGCFVAIFSLVVAWEIFLLKVHFWI